MFHLCWRAIYTYVNEKRNSGMEIYHFLLYISLFKNKQWVCVHVLPMQLKKWTWEKILEHKGEKRLLRCWLKSRSWTLILEAPSGVGRPRSWLWLSVLTWKTLAESPNFQKACTWFFRQKVGNWCLSFKALVCHSPLKINVCEHVHAQLCPALCDPMDCSPPGSSVHGILQARILEW